MPTGRPDYWYGTALYFEDSPADGEVTRGPTSNWAHDHAANINAHHVPSAGGDIDHADITNVTVAQHHAKYTDAEALTQAQSIIDDTPADGDTTHSPSSNWAFDHKADVSAHHSKYLDAEAVAAVEAIVDDTPVDGATDQPASSNWAFDHNANAAAHHAQYRPEDLENLEMGKDLDADVRIDLNLYTSTSVNPSFAFIRNAGWHGDLLLYNQGQGDIKFYTGATLRLTLLNGGGLTGCWDDTPTNAEVTKGTTSDWAYDHVNNATAHHTLPDVFENRGNVGSWDYTAASFTKDATYRDLDLSSIVGAQACLVLLRVEFQNDTVGEFLGLRENGVADDVSSDHAKVLVANVLHDDVLWVMTDVSGVIEYKASAGGTWATINICVRGWLEKVS